MKAGFLTALCVLGSISTIAQGLQFDQRRTLATFSEHNLARNVGLTATTIILPESDTNSVSLINRQTLSVKTVPATRQPHEVFALGKGRFVVNDPYDGVLSLLDSRRGKLLAQHDFPLAQGPIYITLDGGFLYGTDFILKQITKFDLRSRTVVKQIPAGEGPHDVQVLGNRLYVLERGVITAPDDDFLAVYDKHTLQLLDRHSLVGLARRLQVIGTRLCLTYDVPSRVACGDPELGWDEAAVPLRPESLTEHQGQLYVLSRGGTVNDHHYDARFPTPGEYAAHVSVLKIEADGSLTNQAVYDLTPHRDLVNPRFIQTDVVTNSLIVKAERDLVSIPFTE